MSGSGKIDIREPAMAENDVGQLIGTDAIVVRSTMLHASNH
jgi:hypothetical protein